MARVVQGILGVLFIIIGLIPFTPGYETSGNDVVATVFCGVVGIALLYRCIAYKRVKQRSMEKKHRNAEFKQSLANQRDRASRTISGEHMAGLPLGEGTAASMEFGDTSIVINGGGNEFTLSYDKISAAEVKSDVEIQKAYVSSVGGAVGGAVLFGPLGAMIGGRAKEKKTTVTEYYFIITYIKDGEVNYISLKIPEPNHANKIIRRFEDCFTGKAQIEL